MYLSNNVSVTETNDETVLRSVVLVLVLNDEALSSKVVRLAFPPPLEFDLVALEVRSILDDLHERLKNEKHHVT